MKIKKHVSSPLTVLRNRRGMTILEVMTSFVVMLLLVAMFTGVVQMASGMIARAGTVRTETAALLGEFYKGNLEETLAEGMELGTAFHLTDGTASISLPVSVYRYADAEGRTLYTFGRHRTTVENGGG